MGGGTWKTDVYRTRTKEKIDTGTPIFTHSATAHATGRYEVHENLDPKRVAGPTSPYAGKIMRESRDSDEHPESLPIAVLFDVTGSMHSQPRILQEKLPKLYGMLMEKGYVEHPQILFGAIGDATSDRVPLQIGQFESDNRADEDLENIFLEGGGGGGNHESYQLAAYFMANHTVSDSMEKRGKKGYCFIIGDERVYKTLERGHIAKFITDDHGLETDLDTKDVFAKLAEQYEVYFLFVQQASYEVGDTVRDSGSTRMSGRVLPDDRAFKWGEVLGQNALILEDTTTVCETIALTIGLQEGTLGDIDEGLDHLRELGTGEEATAAVGKALAVVGATSVATTAGSLPDAEGEDGIEAL